MKGLKRVRAAFLILFGLFIGFVIVLFVMGRSRLNKAEVVQGVPLPTQMIASGSTAAGKHLATISSCTSCHGADLSGAAFVDEAPIGYVPAPNLTTGLGGVGAEYSDADWEMALRHGVGADGRTLIMMPSEHYAFYGDSDLAQLIAYLKALPPVDNDLKKRRIGLFGTIIFGVLSYADSAVIQIDHEDVGGLAAKKDYSAAYGRYLVDITSCRSCHGENLAGNPDQNAGPLGVNITMGGAIQSWGRVEFVAAMESGIKPNGAPFGEEMPWQNYTLLDSVDLEAIWFYLDSLEPLPNNE